MKALKNNLLLIILLLFPYTISNSSVQSCIAPNVISQPCVIQPSCGFAGITTTYERVSSGQQLLMALKKNTPDRFRSLLNQAAAQYQGNPQGFFDLLNQRDEDSFNIIHIAAVTADVENLAAIFDVLKSFYGSNVQGLFDYLVTVDKRGLTILNLVEHIANRHGMELILMRSMNLIGSNKELFFKFMNTGDYKHNWRPLVNAAFDSEYGNVEMMVKVAAHVLGRDSTYFDEFINAVDDDGHNALFYTKNSYIRYLLMKYGARVDTHTVEETSRHIHAERYGKTLNVASNHGDFKLFKETLGHAYEFKDDDELLFEFFSASDSAGWNPFINTAAGGQYDYMALMLKTIDHLFPENQIETKSYLLSNADFEGRTPLHLAILRRHFNVAKLIVDNVVRYAINKPFLNAVLNVANELNGFTPFINMVYASEEYDVEVYDFIKYFIQKMEALFGRDSRMFYLILNMRDYNGWTALAYASDKEVIKLLKSYGAVDTIMKEIKGIGEFEQLVNKGMM